MESLKKAHPNDPREDLIKDSDLWTALLFRFWDMKKEVYYAFHGLRCAGSKLEFKNDKIKFTFSDEFDDDFIKHIKTKYLDPSKDFIQVAMNTLAKEATSKDKKMFEECPF